MQSDLQLLRDGHMRELAQKPNTTVYTVQHTSTHEPWKVERVRRVTNQIVECVRAATSATDSGEGKHLRATCFADPEVVDFKKQHPHLYAMLTDPEMIKDEKFGRAFESLLEVRAQVEAGQISDGEADASATASLMSALTRK